MRRNAIVLIVLIFLAVCLTAVFFVLPKRNLTSKSDNSSSLKVAATFLPVADMAQRIGGADVQVVTLLPPGASPHTFQPTPEQILELQDAKTIFAIGHGIDDWAQTLAKNFPDESIFLVDQGIQLRQTADGTVDPHYWLDAKNGKIMAQNIASELSRLEPSKALAFNQRLQAYLTELDALDARIRSIFQGKTQNMIVTHHDAWQYFAAAYGLKVVGVLEPTPGRELTPQELAALEQTIRQDKITTIYSEPELSTQQLVPLAHDTGVKIEETDPEGGSAGMASYQDILLKNAEIFARNLD